MKTTITFLAIIASASAFVVPQASSSVESEYIIMFHILFFHTHDVELMAEIIIDMVHHIYLSKAIGRYMFLQFFAI